MSSLYFSVSVVRPIATRVEDDVYYIHSDHLGSTSLVTDDSGNEDSRIQYSPYGSIIEQSGSIPTDRLYTGQRFEAGIELYDYRARFYDPLVGSFLSPDSIVPDTLNPAAWNRYGYVMGNPVNYTDPTGHAGCVDLECEHLINPVTGKLIGNKEFTKSFPFGFESVNTKPVPSDADLAFSSLLSASSIMADFTALMVSGAGTMQELGAFGAGFAAGSSEGPIAAVGLGLEEFAKATVVYQKVADEAGDGLGFLGVGLTAVGDWKARNSYITYDRNDGYALVVAPGTQFSVLLATLGSQCPIATCDAAIDSVALYCCGPN